MSKAETVATVAIWVAMNAIAILVAVSPLPGGASAPVGEPTGQHSTARA